VGEATYQPNGPDEDHSPALRTSLATTFKNDPAVILAPWGETTTGWACFFNGCSDQAAYHDVIAISCINYANSCANYNNGSWLQSALSLNDPDHNIIAEAHVYGDNGCGAQNKGACLTQDIAPITQQYPVLFGESFGENPPCTSTNMQVILPWAEDHNVYYEVWT